MTTRPMPLSEMAFVVKREAHRLAIEVSLGRAPTFDELFALAREADRMLLLCCRVEGGPLPLPAAPPAGGAVVSLAEHTLARALERTSSCIS